MKQQVREVGVVRGKIYKSRMSTMNLFQPLLPQTRSLLEGIPAIIDKTFPLPGRFRSALPKDIAELSRLLTSGRGERGLSYMGRPALLSAYIRFFLPWNLYRLCRLLPGLDIHLTANDRVTDLGCGPLTFTAALWISRPDLRSLPLEFQCIDRSGPALDAGKKLFTALAGEQCLWKIHTIKGDFTTVKTQPAALVCAVNVFNEMYGDISRCTSDIIKRNAQKAVRMLAGYGSAESAILVVEPGFPRCGEFIALLRNEYLERGYQPLAPCPHNNDCPFPGGISKAGKNRWCHFAFDTDDAPSALHRLSAAARLPKERAVVSFLFAGKKTAEQISPDLRPSISALRILSDPFLLPSLTAASGQALTTCGGQARYGRYCCSQYGLVLLTGEKKSIEKKHSGIVVEAVLSREKDAKSGALLAWESREQD